jgi:hypothetical protein
MGTKEVKPPTWETVAHRELVMSVPYKIFKCKRTLI